MTIPSPLHNRHAEAGASFLLYGTGSSPGAQAAVVETFGPLEAEYAAVRKGCVLLDLPQRGVVRVTGADRAEFLNRMLTQELKGLEPFGVRRSFWLNRKGRIDADIVLVHLPRETLLLMDAHTAGPAARSLEGFVFSEDVSFSDESAALHTLALHGPTALRLLSEVGEPVEGPGAGGLGPESACVVSVGGRCVVAARCDQAGEAGVQLVVGAGEAAGVYRALVERGLDDEPNSGVVAHGSIRLREAGWHAFNIARIEAGTALFNLDFGPTNLPAETGVLDDRVSFTKGCYLGQEVVARMHALGHPKQRLVALRVKTILDTEREAQPVTGAPVAAADDEEKKPVGAVTSSTRSPMLGDAIVCFAQVKWGFTPEGTRLRVQTDAGWAEATVQDGLVFWSRGSGDGAPAVSAPH